VRQYAGRPHHQHGVGEGRELVLPRDQAVARGEGQLHRVREADHHDERRHHVQEHVEIETGPAEPAERQQDRDDRRKRRNHHERDLAEEDDRDDAAGQDAEDIVGQPIALDRVADLELHYGHTGKLGVEPAAGEIIGHDLAHLADHLAEIVRGNHLRLQRQHDQRQRAVLGQQLAANDLVGFDGFDELVIGVALRQFGREQRGRQLAGLRRLARRKQRHQAAHAIDQLQVGDHVANLFEVFAGHQRLALDHDQHVEFGRREALGDGLVLLVVLRVGAEQLAQRVVDLDALDAEQRRHEQHDEDDHGYDRRLDRNQPHPLEPEGDALARRRRLLDGFDVDVTFGVLVEHTLSSSHVGLQLGFMQFGGAKSALPALSRSALAIEITR
jgi:hypothetical protein